MDERSEQKDCIDSLQAQYGEDIFASQKQVYLIAQGWWDAWTAYVCNDQSKPGPIDNSSLIEDPSDSPPMIKRSFAPSEAEFVSQSIWLRLVHWYGGGPPVELFVIQSVPDYAPVKIYVSKIESDLDVECASFLVSKFMSLKRLKQYLAQRLSVPYYKYRMLLYELDSERCLEGLDGYCLVDVDIDAESKVVLRRIEEKKSSEPVAKDSAVLKQIDDTNLMHFLEEVPQDQETDSASLTSSEFEPKFASVVRNDRAEVQQKLLTALKDATTRLKIRTLRKINKSLERQSKSAENWLRPS
jgi:hypothetical protein